MKKTNLILTTGIILMIGLFVVSGVVFGQTATSTNSNSTTTSSTTTSTTTTDTQNTASTSTQSSLTSTNVLPIINNINKEELKQSLSIKEIQGRVICRELGACPVFADPRFSTEVSIKAAKVTEVSSSTLGISVFGYNYKIDISSAKVLRYSWGISTVDEYSVGDIINVFGYLDQSNLYLIHAQTVRNVSIQNIHTVFKGTIVSVSSSTNSFVLQTGERGNQTVNILAGVRIIIGAFVGTVGDLRAGEKAVVRGTWNRTQNSIQANLIIMDYYYDDNDKNKDNDDRPFFITPTIRKIEDKFIKGIEKMEVKLDKEEKKIENNEGIRKKIEELQKKMSEMIDKLKTQR
ncbi:MAG: hypothetical protein AAB596_00290 [Patescibacteria group bacterium]